MINMDEAINEIAVAGKVEPRVARRVVRVALERIRSAIEADDRVAIRGLGVFVRKSNPQSGQSRILFRATKKK